MKEREGGRRWRNKGKKEGRKERRECVGGGDNKWRRKMREGEGNEKIS